MERSLYIRAFFPKATIFVFVCAAFLFEKIGPENHPGGCVVLSPACYTVNLYEVRTCIEIILIPDTYLVCCNGVSGIRTFSCFKEYDVFSHDVCVSDCFCII